MFRTTLTVTLAVAALLVVRPVAAAPIQAAASLSGLQEVPAIVGSGHGDFAAQIHEDRIDFKVGYDTEGEVTQAHIHIGQPGANGGVSVFLCSNLGNGPAGTPPCPPSPASLEGTWTAVDVVGPAGQGVDSLERLIQAIRAGVTYVNVHTVERPSGELRGQIRTRAATHHPFPPRR